MQSASYKIPAAFLTRARIFWTLQLTGWFIYLLMRALHGLTTGQEVIDYLPVYAIAAFLGLAMSLVMRIFYRILRERPIILVPFGVLGACVMAGLFLSSLELSVDARLFDGGIAPEGLARFSNAMFEATVFLAWSALYFGYHYYGAYNEQRARALKAAAAAHQAQLQMLRYQLNPHFLFNTLNAISTLVLEKASNDANEMLTKLSSFLRYSLHNQPTQKVTLDQEIHALNLYLDIEAVRFGARLRVTYALEEAAKRALIPSLILQPLVENAIKYAIAPSIEGGELRLSAYIAEGYLHLALYDDGPGIEDLTNVISQSGSGVGLVNTRERLLQIYGAQHRFELRNMRPSGFGVFMSLPAELPAELPVELPDDLKK